LSYSNKGIIAPGMQQTTLPVLTHCKTCHIEHQLLMERATGSWRTPREAYDNIWLSDDEQAGEQQAMEW